MVEVFKTNVQKGRQAKQLLSALVGAYPSHRINFDLEDCDRVLRVEGEEIQHAEIIRLMKEKGCWCEIME